VSASYLVRFDDVCPTMDHRTWAAIERLLVELDVRPIVSIVPDNRDPALMVAGSDPAFWDRVRAWDARGWTIAMHGYQHRYVTDQPGLIGLNRYSEFAGLSREEQEDKLRSGLQVFAREGVDPTVWVAPAHSFDGTTVELLHELGVRIISDGLFPLPHVDRRGMLWIPQQLWRFYPAFAGVWTVCVHPNTLGERGLERLAGAMRAHRRSITDVESVRTRYAARPPGLTDALAPPLLKGLKLAKERLGSRRRGTSPLRANA
jgi:predicted deacetylase